MRSESEYVSIPLIMDIIFYTIGVISILGMVSICLVILMLPIAGIIYIGINFGWMPVIVVAGIIGIGCAVSSLIFRGNE